MLVFNTTERRMTAASAATSRWIDLVVLSALNGSNYSVLNNTCVASIINSVCSYDVRKVEITWQQHHTQTHRLTNHQQQHQH